jgi:hypothetical protein
MGTYSVLKKYIKEKKFIHDDDVIFIKLTNATTRPSTNRGLLASKSPENVYVGITVQRLENLGVTHSCDPNSTVELEEKNGNVKECIYIFFLTF